MTKVDQVIEIHPDSRYVVVAKGLTMSEAEKIRDILHDWMTCATAGPFCVIGGNVKLVKVFDNEYPRPAPTSSTKVRIG